jgi:hypothetical protein
VASLRLSKNARLLNYPDPGLFRGSNPHIGKAPVYRTRPDRRCSSFSCTTGRIPTVALESNPQLFHRLVSVSVAGKQDAQTEMSLGVVCAIRYRSEVVLPGRARLVLAVEREGQPEMDRPRRGLEGQSPPENRFSFIVASVSPGQFPD